ncbi:uncharacterized protein LOC119402063 isoform X2 [Rhipicephalus sanguineus]|uniref:uncharacterized protein LOC119402063 isoform X2 n=1 Tax=Rhipicephalus sanguineus TaxID=34632 RepID=UPI0020C3C8BB|nr:uncharacterized protein LOC119402063 isoform X2 [Rhipicephalus sanguineus]
MVTQVTNGQKESQKQTGIIQQGSSQTGNQGTSGGPEKPRPELKLPTIKVSKVTPPPMDDECKVTLPYEPTRKCRRPRWYYDSKKQACRPSCNKTAPFYNNIACDGVCRTVEACDFPMASIPCFFRKVHVVYIYNQWRKKCMKGYDCSYFGNKFPTLRECKQTCKLYEDRRNVEKTTQSSSQISTKRNKILSTMTLQQKMSQSAISSEKGSLSSQTSQGQESTRSISSGTQLSHSVGHSATQQNSDTHSGVQITGQGQASSTSISSHVSGQISKLDSTGSEQGGQLVSGMAGGSGLTENHIVVGGSQHQTISGAAVGSQQSREGETTISSGQHISSQTGAGQRNTILGTTGSSENSIHTNYNGLTGSGQHGSTVSGSSSHSVLVGHEVVTGGQHQTTTSGAGSWHTSSHISGSDTSVSHQTGSSSSVVSASSSTHGQLQETVETCGAPLKTALCMFDVYAMYAYDAYSGTCFMLYDCSLHGNKFPTIQTCRHACVRGAPALPGGARVSVSQGKWNASTQQRGQQSFTGATEAGKQVSSQGQISASQMITRQSTVGGGVSETEMTAQEKREMDKAAAIDEEWFNQQGKLSTLEEQQQFLQKMKLPSVKVSKPKPLPIDPECLITAPPAGKRRCRRRWYYNKNTKTCLPSCSKNAPFSNNIACDGVCRTLEACDFPKASLFCFFRKAYPVYIYDRNSKQCYQGYDCSNFGNKFPTLKECQSTCRLYEEKQQKMAARNTTEISIKQQKMMDAMNHQQSVLRSSTSSAQSSLGSQTATGIPTPVQAGATGGGDFPAHVPAIPAENNNLPTSGNSASLGQATGTVKTVKK